VNRPEARQKLGKVWIVLGVAALGLGIAMGLFMSLLGAPN
jgi:hypothetical protein